MATLEGKIFPFDINPWDRMGFFMDGLIEFFGYRGDFGPAPKLTLMASRTFIFIDHQNFHNFLPIRIENLKRSAPQTEQFSDTLSEAILKPPACF